MARDGSATDSDGVVSTATSTYEIPEAQWHAYRMTMGYNHDGIRDGAYKIWIDGQLRLDASSVKNRHDDNARFVESVQLANYAHSNHEDLSDLWYDNVVIYRGEVAP